MRAEDILHNLDERMDTALELDNWKWEWADTRLNVFRSERGYWAIVFEFVGNHITYADCANYLYIFGNCLRKQGEVGPEYYRYLFTVTEDLPLEGDIWIADKSRWSVIINGHRYDFTPTEDEYHAAGIILEGNGPGSLHLSALLRFLCHHLNHPFFVSEDYLRFLLDQFSDKEAVRSTQGYYYPPGYSLGHEMILFFQTREWQHICSGEKPSELQYFQILAKAIESGDPSLLKHLDPTTFNTDWRKIEAKLIEEGWRDNMEVRVENKHIFIVYKD